MRISWLRAGVASLSVLISGACGGGAGGQVDLAPDARGVLTEAGGQVSVTDASSPAFGARVVAGPGSIGGPEPVQVTIRHGQALPASLPQGVRAASLLFDFEKDSAYHFALPVLVTIPFDPTAMGRDNVPLPLYWDEESGRYLPMGIKSYDPTLGTATFTTMHFTSFLVGLVDDLQDISDAASGIASTLLDAQSGFDPLVDGFFHPNFGGFGTPGGCCLGMALYSTWYYSVKKPQTGVGLHSKYRQGDPDRYEDDVVARTLIASAHAGSSQIWANIWMQASYLLTERGSGLALIAALKATGEPQVMILRGHEEVDPNKHWGHALVISSYSQQEGRFYGYDPNQRDGFVWIEFTPWDGFGHFSKADLYPPLDRFAFEAASTSAFPPEFEILYFGAESEWTSSSYSEIQISTPTLDASSSAPVGTADPVQVTGTVVGGLGRPTSVIYYVNGESLGVAQLGPTGTFAFDIPRPYLESPTNLIWLIATTEPRQWLSAYAGFKEFKLRSATFFVNPGFESGDFTGWTHETHTWQNQTPGSSTPPKSAVVGYGTDPIAFPLQTAFSGSYAGRVNNEDPSYHISSLSQTARAPQSQTLELRFYWAAVLEDPSHDPAEQPFLDITAEDLTSGQVLYSKHFFANDPTFSGWQSNQGGNWKSIPWQTVTINLSAAAGHDIRLRVTAADCALGGHGGYVFLDGDE